MDRYVLFALFVCYFATPSIGNYDIGKFIQPCSMKDQDLDSCLLAKSRELWPKLVQGVREWKFQPLNPQLVSELALTDGGNSAVNLLLKGTNISFSGYDRMQFEGVKADLDKMTFEFFVNFPEFSGKGFYEMKGKILLLPINGKGIMEFRNEKMIVAIKMIFKQENKNGKKMLKLNDVIVNITDVEKNTQIFSNLFGNKQLSDNMNKVISDNSMAFFMELKDRIEVTFASLIFAMFEPLFDNVLLSQLFTDSE